MSLKSVVSDNLNHSLFGINHLRSVNTNDRTLRISAPSSVVAVNHFVVHVISMHNCKRETMT